MSTHTPGPWAWGGIPGRSELSAAGSNLVLDYAGYEGMWPASYNDETDAANLRLIAAAPELLKALEEAWLVLGDLPSTNKLGTRTRIAWEHAQQALKKATEA